MEARQSKPTLRWSIPRHLLQHTKIGEPAKLAYIWLWNEAQGRPATIRTTKAQLAAALGRSERAAGRWLNALTTIGTIQILDSNHGTLTIFVDEIEPPDKPKVARAEPQNEINFGVSVGETAAITPAEPPHPLSEPSVTSKALLPMLMSYKAPPSDCLSDGTDGDNAADSPTRLGELLPKLNDELPNLEARIERVDRRVEWLKEQLDDPNCRTAPLLKVAWAIERGRVKTETVSRVLFRALELRASNSLRTTTGAYFVKSMQRHFQERGVAWSLEKD